MMMIISRMGIPTLAVTAAVVLTACGAGASSVVGGPSSTAPVATTGPQRVSHGGPVVDHVSFVDRLRASGLQVQIVGAVRQPGLQPPGTELRLVGAGLHGPAELNSFNYDATDQGGDARAAATHDAGGIAADGTLRGGGDIWQGPAHWYRADRLLVLYPGSDPAVRKLLDATLGGQFAGA